MCTQSCHSCGTTGGQMNSFWTTNGGRDGVRWLGSRGTAGTLQAGEPVNHCLHPLHPTGWVGDHSRCSGSPARSLQCVLDTSPKANSALMKGSKQGPQGSITGPWPSHRQPLQLSSPRPGCLKHPLAPTSLSKPHGSQSTQRPLLYHTTFSSRERQPVVSSI